MSQTDDSFKEWLAAGKPSFSGKTSDEANFNAWLELTQRKTEVKDIGNQKALRETYKSQRDYVESTERKGVWKGDIFYPEAPERSFVSLLQDLTLGLTVGPHGGVIARMTQPEIDRVKLTFLKMGKISFEAEYFPIFANQGLKPSEAMDKWVKTIQRIEELCAMELKQREDDQRRQAAHVNDQLPFGATNADGMIVMACKHGMTVGRALDYLHNTGDDYMIGCSQCTKSTRSGDLRKAMGKKIK